MASQWGLLTEGTSAIALGAAVESTLNRAFAKPSQICCQGLSTKRGAFNGFGLSRPR